MKFAALMASCVSIMIMNIAYAAETGADDSGVMAFCNEQAELAGIENADEKSQYVKDCVDSFNTPSGESAPQE